MLNIEPPRSTYDWRFSLFGVPVRVHPMFWLIALLMGVDLKDPKLVLLWVLAAFVSILVHEFGHIVAMRRYGERGYVVLHGFGGLAISNIQRRRDPASDIIVSLAGPLAGFALVALLWMVMFAARHPVTPRYLPPFGLGVEFSPLPTAELNLLIYFLFQVNIYWGLFNLLPILPLDGGHVALSLFTLKRPYDAVSRALKLSMITAAVLGALALLQSKDFFLTMFFGYLAFNSYQLLRAGAGQWDRPW